MVIENQKKRVRRAPLIFTVPAYGFHRGRNHLVKQNTTN
jgi:hypothetical protein